MYQIDVVVRSGHHSAGELEYHYRQPSFRAAITAARIALEDAATRITRVSSASVRIIEEEFATYHKENV